MGRRSVRVLFNEEMVAGSRSTHSWRVSSFTSRMATEVHQEIIHGSCSHAVGRAGAPRGEAAGETE
jgi:hypothetical protein